MKIAIEAQRIFRKKKHGMDFVALELIKNLQIIDTINEYYIFVSPGEDECLTETTNFHIIVLKCPTYPIWEQIGLPFAISKINPDILHCTSNTAPLFCKVPLIVTLHDIIYLEKSHGSSHSAYQKMGWYYRKLVVPKILSKCQKVITVSNFERERIKDSLKLPSEKIEYIHNGYSQHFKPIDEYLEITKKYFDSKKWLMFLGNTDPKKNTVRTLKAYEFYVNSTKIPLPLVIVDMNDATIDDILEENQLKSLKKHLIIPGYISNKDLPAIYSGAKVFLYTSLRESFGIPILEAMACGTPVITSNTSSMPEVAGNAALLIDPTKEEEISKELIKLLNDNDLRSSLIEKGFERVKSFSWKNTALNTLEIYKRIK